MELYLQAFVTVLSLLNPIMCCMIFQASESGRTESQRLGDASKAALATVVTWLVMLMVARQKPNPEGGNFVQSTVQSFMGLIVMAMGMQIGLKGLTTYFHLVM